MKIIEEVLVSCCVILEKKKFEVRKGDRIAQLICEQIYYYPEIEEVQGLDNTERASGGFGSTGKN